MTVQLSETVRNARLNAIETAIGASPVLTICGAGGEADVLVTMNLPADWMAAATGGTKSKSGTWSDASADASGEAVYVFIKQSSPPYALEYQGDVSESGGGGDLIIDDSTIVAGQTVTIISWVWTDGNA
jgi:Tfp pilus assembly protein FimT